MRIRYASTSATASNSAPGNHVADLGVRCRARAPAATFSTIGTPCSRATSWIFCADQVLRPWRRRSAPRIVVAAVFERHREVGRVGDDDGRLRGRRAASGGATISRWTRRTRALISGLPSSSSSFVLDFLLGHLQRLRQLVALADRSRRRQSPAGRTPPARAGASHASQPSRPRHRPARPRASAALPSSVRTRARTSRATPISVAATDILAAVRCPPVEGPAA